MAGEFKTDALSSKELAERIANLSPAKRALLELKLKKAMGAKQDKDAIPTRKKRDTVPLSFAQQRLWFLHQLEPAGFHYNIPVVWRLKGLLHIDVLRKALNEIVKRHESLRTLFSQSEEEPVQIISESLLLGLPVTDLSDRPVENLEAEARRLAEEEARRPFDLARGPLLRCVLIRLDEKEHVLLLTMHHIISDGWSMGIFSRELEALYEAFLKDTASPLPNIAVQYADFSEWQRRWLQGKVFEEHLHYWKQQLAGLPPVLELPTDYPRPAIQRFQGAHHSVLLPTQLTEALKQLAQGEKATLFMTLLAAFQLLLQRYTRQTDIVVGAPIAGRNRREVENLIGFFVNTLVLRTDLSGNPSFKELLARVREITLSAYEHQDLPFEKLVEILQPVRDIRYNPMVQVTFAFQNMPQSALRLTDLKATPLDMERGIAQFDLTFFVSETEQGLQIRLVYNTDLFKKETIERMADHYRVLLEGIVASPEARIGSLPMLTASEHRRLLVSWNDTQREYPNDKNLHRLFEVQAAETPENIAISFEGKVLTYGELNEKANQLARYLKKQGVGSGVIVGIMMERCFEMVIGLLGILKAGGAYLPLDPSYPKERILFMLEDSRAPVLLAKDELIGGPTDFTGRIVQIVGERENIEKEPGGNLDGDSSMDDLAYVIYTSGSTGKPKGVMISHRAICNHMHWFIETFSMSADDRVLQKTPFSFDASVWEFYATLLVGGRLIIARPGIHQNRDYLINSIIDRKVTTLQMVPSLMEILLEGEGFSRCTSLRRVFCGGEVLTAELQTRFFDCLDTNLYNLYGPTEAAIDSTYWHCQRGENRQTVPIGHPIANARMYILDPHLQPVPIGVPGELHIGGAGLARGYLNREELTAERFLKDPFSDAPDARMYKTGDLGRWLQDGSIEYLGRNDFQVKMRGFRIELGEIEARIADVENIAKTVVLVREDRPGDQRLVAYYTSKKNGEVPGVDTLRGHLSHYLPDYMLPSAFVLMEHFPLMPSGKIDRRALPAPETGAYITSAFEAPKGETQISLARIWSEILNVERVGIHDNFFELGGHSLLAVKMMTRVRSKLHIELPLRTIFEAPTIAMLVERIDQILTPFGEESEGAPGKKEKDRHDMMLDRIEPSREKNQSGEYPLSFAQQRLWFLCQLEAGGSFYNIPIVWRIKGTIHLEAFGSALSHIVERHEALRTIFVLSNNIPVQKIVRPFSVNLPVLDLSGQEYDEREATVREKCNEEAKRVFDLEQSPLFRCFLIKMAPEEHVLMLNIHHIVFDEWSMDIFTRELWQRYEGYLQGHRTPLVELPIRYTDYAIWQRQQLQGELLEKQLSYWRKRLLDAPPLLELPTDRPRPMFQSFRGDRLVAVFPTALLERLKALSQEAGATLYMTLLAGFQLLLHRYTNRDDILVGSPIAGRNRPEIENLIGFFVNTIVLRTDFSGNPTFRELLERVRETALGAYEHQDVPFEKLVEELKPERSLGYNPLVQVMFSLQDTHGSSIVNPRLEIKPERVVTKISKFDLTLIMYEAGKKLHASLEYNTDLFDHSTIARILLHLERLLEAVVSEPDRHVFELPLIDVAERQQFIENWNDTETDYPKDLCVHQIFASRAKETPEAIAVEFDGDGISYRELDAKSNQLAHYLRSKGVKKGVFVCIYMERSIDMMVGLLGILKAGGAYVPLDPSYPDERLSFMLGESKSPLLLAQQKFSEKLAVLDIDLLCLDADWKHIRTMDETYPDVESGPDDIAYVIYTSGSTGRPKGVCVPHRGINRLVMNTNYITLTASDRVAFASNTSFDAATFEMWGALLNGGCLVGMSREELLSPKHFGEKLRKKGITASFVTTALFNQIAAEAPSAFKSLSSLLFGGEAVDPKRVRAVLQNGAPKRLLHVYGPTENTTFSTWFEVKGISENAVTIPIGKPISNSKCYILDKHFNPVPIGVSGELFLGGEGLAKEYLLRPDLTAEKFIRDPYSQNKVDYLYKTGDIARYLPDGNIEFIGRIDNQVKLRGFRIELGEIEAAVKSHSFVHDAVVMMREYQPGDNRIVAYLVLEPGENVDGKRIRELLQEQLPEYMVPFAIVFLEMLPLTQNGKVDRKALPMPSGNDIAVNQECQAPRDFLEIQLAKIWEKVLGTGKIGIRDNFFDLGGHSLLVVQVLSQIKKAIGKDISVGDFFKAPTIEQLSDVIRHETESIPLSHIRPYQVLGHKPPFYCVFIAAADAANLIDSEQPFYGGAPHGFTGKRIPFRVKNMAIDFINEIKAIQPEGPYFLGGYSFGGIVAYEIACQLKKQGEKIGTLILIDPTTPGLSNLPSDKTKESKEHIVDPEASTSPFGRIRKDMKGLGFRAKMRFILKRMWKRMILNTGIRRESRLLFCRLLVRIGITVPIELRKEYSLWCYRKISSQYVPPKYEGDAVMLKCADSAHAPEAFWRQYVTKKMEVHEIPGGHLDIFKEPYIREFADNFKKCLKMAQAEHEKN